MGLAINPLRPGDQKQAKPSVPVTVGFSVAVNDLSATTSAAVKDSSLSYAPTPDLSTKVVELVAETKDLQLTTVSIAAAGSGTGGSGQGALGSYAIAGSGAGAQNTFSNPISATITGSTIQPVDHNATRDISLGAAADEQILSVTGGLDVAMAFAAQGQTGPTGALSVAASASYNELSGAITAQIDPNSSITANDLSLKATDNSQIGAYAIAGALSAAASKLSSSFGGAFVGAGTGNTIDRPLKAVIGDPDASTPGSGVVRTTSTTLKAERGTQSRIIADAAGAALTFVSTGTGSKSIGASFAGGFAFNELKGGITAGIYNITDYGSSGATAITAAGRKADPSLLADGSIASFAGGFAVSVDLGSAEGQAMAAGGALGLAVSTNTIDDAVTAKIANLSLANPDKALKVGSLSIEAKDGRQLNTQATGDSLTVSSTKGTAVAVGVGAASSRNTMDAAVNAAVELGIDQVLAVANDLTVDAQSLAQIETFALAVALSYADGSSGVALAGGGAGSTNTITAPVTARVKAGKVKGGTNKTAQTTIKAASGETNAQGDVTNSRELVARLGAGSLAVARGRSATSFGASIGAVDVENTLKGNVTAELRADSVNLPGALNLSSVSADKVDTTVAAASMAVGVSQTNASGVAIALSGAGAGARNTLDAASSATVVRFSDALSDATGALTVGGALNLTSISTGSIEANVGSGSLAVSYAGNDSALSLAPSVGVAVATNTLKGDGNAALKGFGSVTVGGDLSLSSTSTRTIDSTSVAVAIGAAIGSKFSLGLAGGGANALNTIEGGSQALLWADTIQADPGTISLAGTSSDTITAQVQAIAGAGQGSATGSGGAVSIGASVARNRLGVSSDGPDASGDGLAIGASVRGHDGQAGVKSLAAQSLTLKADQTSTIDATVGATSAAIAWTGKGSVGVAASGAGSEATNTLKQNVIAEAVGAGEGATLTLGNGDLTLSANDTSSLTTTAWGAALAVSVAPAAQFSAAPAVGVSLADNTLIRRQKAGLQGFRRDGNGLGGVGSAGAVAITSGSTGRIQATSVAVAIAGAAAKDLAVGLSGGGAHSFNTILGTNQALIEDSDLGVDSAPIAGTLTVTATAPSIMPLICLTKSEAWSESLKASSQASA